MKGNFDESQLVVCIQYSMPPKAPTLIYQPMRPHFFSTFFLRHDPFDSISGRKHANQGPATNPGGFFFLETLKGIAWGLKLDMKAFRAKRSCSGFLLGVIRGNARGWEGIVVVALALAFYLKKSG